MLVLLIKCTLEHLSPAKGFTLLYCDDLGLTHSSLCLLCSQEGEEENTAGCLFPGGWALLCWHYNQTWVGHSAFISPCLFWMSRNQFYAVHTLTIAVPDCIPSPQSGSPPLWNAVPPLSHPPSRSHCALSCYEPPCWERRCGGDAAVALRTCQKWWTWSMTPSSWVSPHTVNRSWWCVWLGCSSRVTRWWSPKSKC